ncbi:MAG: ADP-heptose--lipopolysaccharide heptosyltransferase [Candidatus Kaiserbacteria bacterium]|nr:ADP-heptose--lipopolysaccharide heptosyltransferase [Candidatus Kaiserbacteria bacterium]
MTGIKKPKRGLYIANGAIGDFLMTISVFKAIHTVDPQSHLLVLTSRNLKLLTDIAKQYPFVQLFNINDPLTYLPKLLSYEKTYIFSPYPFGRENIKVQFYKVILQILTLGTIIRFSKNPQSRTFFDLEDTYFINQGKISYYFIGQAIDKTPPRYDYLPDDRIFHNVGVTPQHYIVMHIFASNPIRSLPEKRWVEIVQELKQTYPNIPVILSGSSDDYQKNREFLDSLHCIPCFETTWAERCTMIDNCSLFIGVDTGITHLASLLQKKIVEIGNLSNPTWLVTYNPNAIVLFSKKDCICKGNKLSQCFSEVDGKQYFRCMLNVTNKEILDAASILLKN